MLVLSGNASALNLDLGNVIGMLSGTSNSNSLLGIITNAISGTTNGGSVQQQQQQQPDLLTLATQVVLSNGGNLDYNTLVQLAVVAQQNNIDAVSISNFASQFGYSISPSQIESFMAAATMNTIPTGPTYTYTAAPTAVQQIVDNVQPSNNLLASMLGGQTSAPQSTVQNSVRVTVSGCTCSCLAGSQQNSNPLVSSFYCSGEFITLEVERLKIYLTFSQLNKKYQVIWVANAIVNVVESVIQRHHNQQCHQ